MVLQPGESTIVEWTPFTMHEVMDGPHDFAVHLVMNDSNHPDGVVNVISDWGP
jgi:hypothetical protein